MEGRALEVHSSPPSAPLIGRDAPGAAACGLDAAWRDLYPVRMKRTNLVLDENVLEEATRLSGAKTYSSAVMKALEDFIRRAKARRILDLTGCGLWEGDLAEMRRDARRRRRK